MMPDHVIKVGTGGMNIDAPQAKLWLTSPFAREWYADALREARDRDGRHPRRREIVFAVCCVESYLVEWVLIEVLNRDFDQLAEYFPGKRKPDPDGRTGGLYARFKRFLRCVRGRGPKRERQRVGVSDRWKNVIKKLESKGKIAKAQDFGTSTWGEFRKLVDYRDGLVHGVASRPYEASQAAELQPNPSPDDFDNKIEAGWPTKVVYDLLSDLHTTMGTKPPTWLEEPN